MANSSRKNRADIHRTEQTKQAEISRHNERSRIAAAPRANGGILPKLATDTNRIHESLKSSTQKKGLRLAESWSEPQRILKSLLPSSDWLTFNAVQGELRSWTKPGEELSFRVSVDGGVLKAIRLSNQPQPTLLDGSERKAWDPLGQAVSEIQSGGSMPWENPPPDAGWVKKDPLQVSRCSESNVFGEGQAFRRRETEYREKERQLIRFFGEQSNTEQEQPTIKLEND